MNIEELTKLASIHEATDYADSKAVKAGNKAADALRAGIMEYCEATRFDELLDMLAHKSLGEWLLFLQSFLRLVKLIESYA